MDHPRGHLYTLIPPRSGTPDGSSWPGMLDSSVLTAALRRNPVAHQAFLEFTGRFRETWVAGLPHPMPATFAHGPDGVLRVRQSLPLPDGEEVVLEGEQLSREVPPTPG